MTTKIQNYIDLANKSLNQVFETCNATREPDPINQVLELQCAVNYIAAAVTELNKQFHPLIEMAAAIDATQNGRLFSAAPDLLSASKQVLEWIGMNCLMQDSDGGPSVVEALAAAIQRAEFAR